MLGPSFVPWQLTMRDGEIMQLLRGHPERQMAAIMIYWSPDI